MYVPKFGTKRESSVDGSFLYANLNGGKFMNENIIIMKAALDNILPLMIKGIFCCAIIMMICGLITSLYYFFIKHKGLKKSVKPMFRTLMNGLTSVLAYWHLAKYFWLLLPFYGTIKETAVISYGKTKKIQNQPYG